MNLPNKITISRVLLSIILLVLLVFPFYKFGIEFPTYVIANGKVILSLKYMIAGVLFLVASLTDFLDGYLARKNNQVTTFGKFLDPLADKMLVFSSMTILLLDNSGVLPEGPLVPMWVFVIMLIREFMVSGIRMLVSSRGVVIAAGWMGKWKTFITMIAIGALFMSGLHISITYIGQIFMYIACILTIVSGIEYFWKSRKIILESM